MADEDSLEASWNVLRRIPGRAEPHSMTMGEAIERICSLAMDLQTHFNGNRQAFGPPQVEHIYNGPRSWKANLKLTGVPINAYFFSSVSGTSPEMAVESLFHQMLKGLAEFRANFQRDIESGQQQLRLKEKNLQNLEDLAAKAGGPETKSETPGNGPDFVKPTKGKPVPKWKKATKLPPSFRRDEEDDTIPFVHPGKAPRNVPEPDPFDPFAPDPDGIIDFAPEDEQDAEEQNWADPGTVIPPDEPSIPAPPPIPSFFA